MAALPLVAGRHGRDVLHAERLGSEAHRGGTVGYQVLWLSSALTP
jgi:hypothetical protein